MNIKFDINSEEAIDILTKQFMQSPYMQIEHEGRDDIYKIVNMNVNIPTSEKEVNGTIEKTKDENKAYIIELQLEGF